MIEVEANRFFPTDPDVIQLAISFRIFLTLLTSMGKFGENLQYSLTDEYIYMNFDLQEGATLNLSISKISNDTWAAVNKNQKGVGEVTELSEIYLGSNGSVLYLQSAKGLFTIDKLGHIQEITTVASTNTQTSRSAREIATQIVAANLKALTDQQTKEEVTKPSQPILEAEIGESTEIVVALPSSPNQIDNAVILKSTGEPIEAKPKMVGGWHLPTPKNTASGTTVLPSSKSAYNPGQ